MTSKLLQVFGLFAVLGLAGFGAAGLFVFKDRVRVIVQDDSVEADDPTAVLRDDVRTLGADVQALSRALGENLGRLMQVVEEAAAARHAEVLASVASVGAGPSRAQQQAVQQEAVLRQTAAILARLTAIETRLSAAATMSGESARLDEVAAEPAAPPELEAAEQLAAQQPSAEPAPAASSPAMDVAPPRSKPKPRATGFLNFNLPSRSFTFDARQRFELIASLSRVGFDAKSTLHDFSGVTSDLTGELVANLADQKGKWSGRISCQAGKLITGVDGRDEAMREHLDTVNHPQIEFVITGFEPADNGIDAERQTVKGTAVGKMTIRGVTKDLRMPVEVSVDSSKRLVVVGQTKLLMPDYKVPVPSKLGVINTDPEVNIWVALRLRVRAEAAR